MKHFLYISVSFLLVFSISHCSFFKKNNRELSEEKMIDIIVDLELIKGLSDYNNITYKIKNGEIEFPTMFDSVYKKHGVEKELFLTQIENLNKDYKKLEKIYERVIENLNERKTVFEKVVRK